MNTNLSYFTLRKIIGWSGLLLTWLVWLIAGIFKPSIIWEYKILRTNRSINYGMCEICTLHKNEFE